MRIALAAVTAILVLSSPEAVAQDTPAPAPECNIDQALKLNDHGLIDQAIVCLRELAAHEEARGAREEAATALYILARLYQEVGQQHEGLNVLSDALRLANGTHVEPLISATWSRQWATLAVLQGDLLSGFESLLDVFEELEAIENELERKSVESQALYLLVSIYQFAAEPIAAAPAGIPVDALPPDQQLLVLALLSDQRPSAIVESSVDPATGKLTDEMRIVLEEARPWASALLDRALKLNDQVTALDGQFLDGLAAEVEVAKDRSQRAQILHVKGATEAAIELKQQALQTFEKANLRRDTLVARADLRDLYLDLSERRRDRPEEAIEAFLAATRESGLLIAHLEREVRAFTGETLQGFLAEYGDDYRLHYHFLLAMYLAVQDPSVVVSDDPPSTERVLGDLLWHLDRMNFRAFRRDLAVYRELGAELGRHPGVAERLEETTNRIVTARADWEAALAKGRRPEDFEVAPGITVDSPFLALDAAKKELLSILADFKRVEVGGGEEVHLPGSVSALQIVIPESAAVVAYFREPAPTERWLAAVIDTARVRLVDLSDPDLENLSDHLVTLSEEVDLQMVGSGGSARRLGELLWDPLGDLPETVTIVLAPDLIGLPFELLEMADGRRVVEKHLVRYSFGLPEASASLEAINLERGALLAGAASFSSGTLSALPDVGIEVESLRDLMVEKAIRLAPGTVLPQEGQSLVLQEGEYAIVLLSTHSRLDTAVPQLDSLVFPKDEVLAYDLALAKFRSDLLILNACKLFSPRPSRISPVSGVTTAGLARVSPQVLATLWNVNSASGSLFMLRFFDNLLRVREPTRALALTKRDFLSPDTLGAWIQSSDLSLGGLRRESLVEPYFWAPFVLTVSGYAD